MIPFTTTTRARSKETVSREPRVGDDAETATRVKLPGGDAIEFTRDKATGALREIVGRGRTYLRIDPGTMADASATWHWIDVCSMRERRIDQGCIREVEATAGASWRECYRWSRDRLIEVDGVEVRRDGDGRVIACLPGGDDPAPATHRWFYTRYGGGVVHIAGPCGERTIAMSSDGRVRSCSDNGRDEHYRYDGDGRRIASPRPARDHVDDAGRCWARVDTHGHIEQIYLWDGSRCLARIDGPLGAPLAAVFSLDPSATPVRVIEPGRVIRIPRDAYGEGLLAHRGVPGLFGGQVCDGLVHLPLRRLDPRTASFCEPDPCDGSEADPRRPDDFEGALPVEPEPRSAYEVCRGDPIGRADPSGGVSAGLIVSTLTWSFQNNILTFFGIDWWFNLFASLIVAPFKNVPSSPIEYDFFSSTGLSANNGQGGFGIRRGGIINAITGGRAFTTQHLIWSPDSEFAVLEQGEVFDPGGTFTPSHYGSILSLAPKDHDRVLLASMALGGRSWVTSSLGSWSRHGGRGVAVAPGTLTPWFPTGGLHFDTTIDTRHDTECTVTELIPGAVALGDLEPRSYLTAASTTGLAAGDRVLVSEGTSLAIVQVVGVVAVGSGQRIQLDSALTGFGNSNLTLRKLTVTAASTESLSAASVTNSLGVHGTTATYQANDLLRLTASTNEVTVARIARVEAQLAIERQLPTMTGPITVTRGVLGSAVTVTMAGANLDFAAATRPAIDSDGIVSGGGAQVGVHITGHGTGAQVTLDTTLPASITGASPIRFQPVVAGTTLGTRAEAAEATAVLTYTPTTAGTAPDGSAGLVVLHLSGGGVTRSRVVPSAPNYDAIVLDRAAAGTAPWSTERFAVFAGSSDIGSLSRSDVVGLVVPDPAPFASAPAVFLTKVTGSPPTAATVVLSAINVAAGLVTTTQAASFSGSDIEPGQPLLVGTRAAAVKSVRVTVKLDRAFDLAATNLRAVGLTATGTNYRCTVRSASEIIAEAQVTVGGSAVDVPFPRFEVGDIVRVNDPGAGGATWHRVTSVTGGVLQLADGPNLTAGAANVTVRAVATVDPGHGGPFLAIDGTRTGSGATDTASFAVWRRDALRSGTVIGVIDGDQTHPATIVAGTQNLEITFSDAFDASGVDIASLTRLDDRFVTTLSRDGGVLLLEGTIGTLATAASESLIAVALVNGSVSTTGTIGPGTLLTPNAESAEVKRSEALANHELQHTLQYSKWGPLWFCAFPMIVMELPGILATDTELPEYSRFLDAAIATGTGSRWDVTISNTAGVSIGVDDHLQIIQGSRRAKVKVVSVSGQVYTVRAESGAPPTGIASVRKQQNASTFDGFYAFFDLLTHGGLVNVTAGSTWGGIFWLIGKGIYGLGRAIGGTGDLYPATVQSGGGAVTLTDQAGRDNIRSSGRVVVRQGDNTIVRSMTRNGDVVTLTSGVTFTGDVRIAMYDTHDPGSAFDWYDYYPATADADNPARIQFAPPAAGESSLSLSPEDRVEIKYRDQTFKTDVLAVNGNTVELLQAITVVGGELSLRIAKVGSSDPLGNADSAAMVEMGMGWMKWLFDPYGQIEFAVAPQQEWARWLLRVMRWILGTQNFSLLPFGYLWWGRLFPIKPEHMAPIEQEASENSGDLYSPLGRVYGEQSGDGFAKIKMRVGDIIRYHYWPLDRTASFVTSGQLDAPGVQFFDVDGAGTQQTLRILPNRTSGGGTTAPNQATVVDTSITDPGNFVAEPFTQRGADPRVIPGADTLGFSSSDLGRVPVSARIQKTLSAYAAFTRPGQHRVTTRNSIFGAAEAVDTHGDDLQALYFDITVDDVEVSVAGQTLANGASVTMVPFQTAAITVTPNASRAYRVSLSDPSASTVLRSGTAMQLVARGVGNDVPVEISRFYDADASGNYGSGGLAHAGMHLSRDLHIPVRRFEVDVVNTVPLRDAARATATELTTLAIGADGFFLIPAPIARAPRVTSIAGAPPAAGAGGRIERAEAFDQASFLGASGAAFKITFPTGSATGAVVITIGVGDATTTVDVTCSFTLTA